MTDSLVIIPCYNEKENVESIIRAVFSLDKEFHVLIIEDNSPDGTAEIVRGLMNGEFNGRLFMEERKGKLGLGTAYIHGFKWALQRGYEYIYEMDADFSHNPKDLLKLYKACSEGGADVAIGSRYINGVTVIEWPIGRVIMSYYASVYVRSVLGITVQDTTAGFKCYRRKVLETIALDKIKFMGYAFQVEMKFNAWKHGFNLVEVPIIFRDRRLGTSKMSTKIFKEAFLGILQMRMNAMFRKFEKVK